MDSRKAKARSVAGLVAMAIALSCVAGERSSAQRRAFLKMNPCPSTGKSRGPCPYVVDHVIPLCAGGPDLPSNMQYQEKAESLRKDADERRLCRALKK